MSLKHDKKDKKDNKPIISNTLHILGTVNYIDMPTIWSY